MAHTLSPQDAGPRPSPPAYTPVIRLVLLGLTLAFALLAGAASALPYLPGDLPATRAVQSYVPLPSHLAAWITHTADRPGCFILAALAVAGAWFLGGWRAGVLAAPVIAGAWLSGVWLSPLVAQPRPSPELVQVVGQPKGYGFPSIFAVVYMAAFGHLGVLAWVRTRGALRVVVPASVLVVLAIGAVARIGLGAHWPSEILGGYLLGLLWVVLSLPLSRPKENRPNGSKPVRATQ